MAVLLLLGLLASFCNLPTPVQAYIPAVSVNDTSSLDSSSDLLHLAFYNGVYNTPISRQLWAEGFDDNGNYTNVSTIVPWTKYSKGVLIHFDETLRNQPPTSVPWVAMINCDTNGTNPSEEDDIFTITRDLGAQAALLYSLTSEGCQITQDYLTNFEKVLDVFATTTLQGSRIIESQFVNVNTAASRYDSLTLNNSAAVIQSLLDSNALSVIGNIPINASSSVTGDDGVTTVEPTAIAAETSPSVFDPDSDDQSDGSSASDQEALSDASITPTMTMPSLFSDISSAGLRRRQATATSSSAGATGTTASRTSVAASASSTSQATENYLGAVMAAANLTVGGLNSASSSPTASSGGGGGGGARTSTSLAMIILYAITGVVTFLFLIVILSGAIRAARHPERYGPRPAGGAGAGGVGGGGGEGGAQTRASGLTRAILDTFPIVKFGNGNGAQAERRDEEARAATEAGDDDDETNAHKKVGSPADLGEQIELAVLPGVLRTSPDGDAPQTVLPVAAANAGEVRPRAASRASTSAESFHSAATTQTPDPTSSVHATGLATSVPATLAAGPHQPVPSQAAVEATLASAADAAEADLCPICFCDFEEGDELRVLPCDNRHRFHSACIDPFLLNVSRLCPLCRLDLATVAPHADEGNAGHEHADNTDGERHEEERVIRHLRTLLHRGSHSNPADAPRLAAATTTATAPSGESVDGMGGDIGDGGTAGFRNRFAQYVTARRGRARRGSSFSTGRVGASFSAWAAGPVGDGRIGAPV